MLLHAALLTPVIVHTISYHIDIVSVSNELIVQSNEYGWYLCNYANIFSLLYGLHEAHSSEYQSSVSMVWRYVPVVVQ
jgi:hypothetical protein